MQQATSTKQLRKREAILNGNMWKTILLVSLPIMFYNLCNYLYGIFDMMVVQSSGIGEAADIVVLDQIKNMISTIGSSLAAGGAILVARRYGEKKIKEAKKCANCLFTLASIIALLTLVFIPIGIPLLKLLQTAQSTIDNAMGYYYVQILIVAITTINNTFIALEKSKGNTAKLFGLNIGVIIIKIGLSSFFAFGPLDGVTTTHLALATLTAQGFLFICGIIILFNKNNILGIKIKEFNLNKADTKTILILSFPIFIGRFLFNFGKVYVNSVATNVYGKDCVGALGISNTMAGLITNMDNSFEDGGSTICSQNYGNANGRRIRKFYLCNLVYVMFISIVGLTTLYILKEHIAGFFAGDDKAYQEMIVVIFSYECLDLFFTGLSASANCIFYGFGRTRITMGLSMSNLFAFRIPTLLLCIYAFNIGYEACGICMFVSNTIVGIISTILVVTFLIRLPKNKKYTKLFNNSNEVTV